MKKIPNSPITGNFSQKDVNDGIINKQKQKAAVEGGVKDEHHIFLFIKMQEENPCLWDILYKDYTKRNANEITTVT